MWYGMLYHSTDNVFCYITHPKQSKMTHLPVGLICGVKSTGFRVIDRKIISSSMPLTFATIGAVYRMATLASRTAELTNIQLRAAL